MRILHLTLYKKWFDLIASGEKTEEYRDGTNYWDKRLNGKSYDVVHFTNGYGKTRPSMDVEYKGHHTIQTDLSGKHHKHVITLGKVITVNKADVKETKNVIIPRWMFEIYSANTKLVNYLSKVKGSGWINAVREEMETDNIVHQKEVK